MKSIVSNSTDERNSRGLLSDDVDCGFDDDWYSEEGERFAWSWLWWWLLILSNDKAEIFASEKNETILPGLEDKLDKDCEEGDVPVWLLKCEDGMYNSGP